MRSWSALVIAAMTVLMSTSCCLATSAIVVLPSLSFCEQLLRGEVERLGGRRRSAASRRAPGPARRGAWPRSVAAVGVAACGNGCAPDSPGTPSSAPPDAADRDRRTRRRCPSSTDFASCCVPPKASGGPYSAPRLGHAWERERAGNASAVSEPERGPRGATQAVKPAQDAHSIRTKWGATMNGWLIHESSSSTTRRTSPTSSRPPCATKASTSRSQAPGPTP